MSVEQLLAVRTSHGATGIGCKVGQCICILCGGVVIFIGTFDDEPDHSWTICLEGNSMNSNHAKHAWTNLYHATGVWRA